MLLGQDKTGCVGCMLFSIQVYSLDVLGINSYDAFFDSSLLRRLSQYKYWAGAKGLAVVAYELKAFIIF